MLFKEWKDVVKALDELPDDISDDERRIIEDSYAKFLSDYNSNMAAAEEKGRLKGIEEGRLEAIEEGRLETQLEVLKRMIELKKPLKFISMAFNLPEDKIKELIKDNDL